MPLAKPVVGVRIGWTEAKGPIVHPTLGELEEGKLDLILAGSSDGVIMIEGYADFLPEEEMIKVLAPFLKHLIPAFIQALPKEVVL